MTLDISSSCLLLLISSRTFDVLTVLFGVDVSVPLCQ